MKKYGKGVIVFLLAVVFCMAFTFAGCSACGLSDEPLETKIIADFTKTEAERTEVFESDGWENKGPFNTWWVEEDVKYNEGYASLHLSEKTGNEGEVAQYYGGEMRTSHYYGYGDFKVRMKPSAVSGTASTFFTCTGPYDQWYNEDGEVVKTNDHDEIDIEFLGKDTTKVQFNYFADGVGGHEYMYDLGFDASKEYHEYGFRWTENDITWFVDNEPVYKVKRENIKEGESWPEEPGRIIMNYWCGHNDEDSIAWMGEFKDDFTGHADYHWISSTATPQVDPSSTKPGASGGDGEQVSEPIPTDIMWSEPTMLDFTTNTSTYTITPDETNKKTTVSYTEAEKGSYETIVAAVGEAGSKNNYIGLTLTSKTDKAISVRVNAIGDEGNLAKKSYVSEGTTSIDGGALCTVPANGTLDIVVYYEGALKNIELMIDSTAHQQSTANTLEISNMKLGLKGELVESAPTQNEGIYVGEELIKFTGSTYTIASSTDKKSMTVSYENILGNGYTTIAGSGMTFGSNNTFTFKVKNNGAETAKVRVDIGCPKSEATNNNTFCNTSAVISGALEFGNDYQYNGADWLKIAAGETATVTITFNAAAGANNITFFIDSSTFDDETTHTGSLVFSEMALSTVAAE